MIQLQGEMLSQLNCQKKCTIAQVIQMISHDLMAPLGTIEGLLLLPDDAVVAPHKRAISESLRRLTSMIKSLRHYDLEALIIRKPCSMDLREGYTGLESKAIFRGLTVMFSENTRGNFLVDHAKLERAYVNLLANALDAAKSMVRIELEIQNLDLYIRVIDDGTGIPLELEPNLFQRGMTFGKPGGTGLGLAYARQIVNGHGGEIYYRRDNGWTVFECLLPNALCGPRPLRKENSASAISPVSKKIVSMALVPASLNNNVHRVLASMNTDHFEFLGEYSSKCDLVVTNDDKVISAALENDYSVLIHINHLQSETQIIDLLKRRLNLV